MGIDFLKYPDKLIIKHIWYFLIHCHSYPYWCSLLIVTFFFFLPIDVFSLSIIATSQTTLNKRLTTIYFTLSQGSIGWLSLAGRFLLGTSHMVFSEMSLATAVTWGLDWAACVRWPAVASSDCPLGSQRGCWLDECFHRAPPPALASHIPKRDNPSSQSQRIGI